MTRGRVRRVGAAARAAAAVASATTIVEMGRGDDDWWSPADGPVPDGEVDYGYLLDDADTPLPDPRSRRQPRGRARALAHLRPHAFDVDRRRLDRPPARRRRSSTSCTSARSRPRAPSTRRSGRLDHLRSIGVDFVELMPVNAVNGTHNWGYDGVLWSAVHEQYGGPAAYQRFVDGCHAAGLGVIQDVVYNHLGPSGNYLPLFGPYLKSGANTWGDLVNLDGEGSAEVRRYILDNVRDVARATTTSTGCGSTPCTRSSDSSEVHLLEEMAVEVGRPVGPPAPAADADRGVRPQRPAADHAARGRRLRPRRAVERRLPPRRARGADPGDRPATTPTSSRWPRWPRCARRASSTTARSRRSASRDHGVPIDTAAMPDLAAGRLQPEPRPDRQPRRRRPDHRDARRRPAGLRRAARRWPGRSRRCCSRARSGRPRRRSSSSPRTRSRSSAGRPPRAGSRSSSRWAGTRRSCPTRRTPRPYQRSQLDWAEVGDRAARADARRPTGGWPRCAARRPQLTDPSFERTACTVDEEARVFTMRPRRPARSS